MKNLVLVLVSLLLTSCAALEQNYKNTCASYDWEAMGSRDALAGESMQSSVLSQCMQHGIPATRTAYDQGYARGLMQFCTYEYGIYWGREGKDYENTCTPSVANNFLAGYSKGKMEYQRLQVAKAQVVAIQRASGQSCTFDSDCEIKIECKMSSSAPYSRQCAGNGKTCNFDSDCTLPGSCSFNTCTNR
ncbi:DUF2799 domain-containing protein [Bdellovibrio sp. KM01]|uniref:DUF2799 domain-containing protein n=1 Tax=Bdellovibrio sp. KM01 TaxID=2748865 RepID=UPI0015EABAB2|nr:DUF2799 domain-containing protein [Bdellovibrio sp. KM01]QLY24823.1 DUF2799 domain-containing protein [Bdellovibrio sp. KM01]